jgi:acetyltransferase-like isoleucine patch superfamily enzyme
MKAMYQFFYLFKGGVRKLSHLFTDLACKRDVLFEKGVRFKMTSKVENISGNRNNITIGKSTLIEGRLLVFKHGGKIAIGSNVYIGAGTNIWSAESITIGNNVLISHNVNVMDTNSHEIDHLERRESYYQQMVGGPSAVKGNVETGKIVIEDDVWISFNAIILKNVTIGKGAVIAAGSIVTKDVPPYCVMAGNPARVVKIISSPQ